MPRVFTLLIFSIFSVSNISAQIAIAVAKENDFPFSAIEYRVEWGYGDYSEAAKHSMKYLENKGYKKVYNQVTNDSLCKVSKGYYVVVKADYKIDKKTKISYGLGVSSVSNSNAEKSALENLSTYDWNWGKNIGYTIVKQGTFDNSAQRQLICISTTKTSSCGENTIGFSYMKGTYDNSMYVKIYKSYIKQNTDTSTRKNYVRHILRDNGYFAILKCNQKCSDNSLRSFYKVVEADTQEEIKLTAPYDATTISEAGETKYFLYSEIMAANDDIGGSILKETMNYLNKLLKITYPALLEKWGSFGSRD